MNNVQGAVGGQNVNHTGVTADAVTSYTQNKYPILTRYHGGQHPLAKEASNTKLEPLPETRAAFIKALTAEMTGNGQGTLDPHTVKKYQDKMVLEGLGENVDLMYAREFQRWLRGVSVFNEPRLTPWGHRNMFHVPGVTEYLRELIQLRFDYQQSLMHLYMQPPQSLFDLELYYKYIVLQFGLVIPRNDGVRDPATTMSGTDPRSFMSISGMLYFLDDYQMTSFVSRDLPLTDQALVDAGDLRVDALAPSLTRDHGTLDSVVLGTGPVPPAPNGQPLTTAPTAPAPVAPNIISAILHQQQEDRRQRAAELAQLRADAAARQAQHDASILQLQAQHQANLAQQAKYHQTIIGQREKEREDLQKQIDDLATSGGTPDAAMLKQLRNALAAQEKQSQAEKKAANDAAAALARTHRLEMKQMKDDERVAREKQEKAAKALETKLHKLELANARAVADRESLGQRLEAAETLVRTVTLQRTEEQEAEFQRRVAEISQKQVDTIVKHMGGLSKDIQAILTASNKNTTKLIKQIGSYDALTEAVDKMSNIQGFYEKTARGLLESIKQNLLDVQKAAAEDSAKQLAEARLATAAGKLSAAERKAMAEKFALATETDKALVDALAEITKTITTLSLPVKPEPTPVEKAAIKVIQDEVEDLTDDMEFEVIVDTVKKETADVPDDVNNRINIAIKDSLATRGITPEMLLTYEKGTWEQRASLMDALHTHRKTMEEGLKDAYNMRMLEFGIKAVDSFVNDLKHAGEYNEETQQYNPVYADDGEYRNAMQSVFYAVLKNPLFSHLQIHPNLHATLTWTLQKYEDALREMYFPDHPSVNTPVQLLINMLNNGEQIDRPYFFRVLDTATGNAPAAAWINTTVEDAASEMQVSGALMVLQNLAEVFSAHDVSTTLPSAMDVEGEPYASGRDLGTTLAFRPVKDATEDDKVEFIAHYNPLLKQEAKKALERLKSAPEPIANLDALSGYEVTHGVSYATSVMGGLVDALSRDDARPVEVIASVGAMAFRQYGEHATLSQGLVDYILSNNTAPDLAQIRQLQEYASTTSMAFSVADLQRRVIDAFYTHVEENNEQEKELQLPYRVIDSLDQTVNEMKESADALKERLQQIKAALAKTAVQERALDPRYYGPERQLGAALLAVGNTTAPEVIDLTNETTPANAKEVLYTFDTENASVPSLVQTVHKEMGDYAAKAPPSANFATEDVVDKSAGVLGRAFKQLYDTLETDAPVIPQATIDALEFALMQKIVTLANDATKPLSKKADLQGQALAVEVVELAKIKPVVNETLHHVVKGAIEKHPVESNQLAAALDQLNALQRTMRPRTKASATVSKWQTAVATAMKESSISIKKEPEPRQYRTRIVHGRTARA